MMAHVLPFGTRNAAILRGTSKSRASETADLKTLKDLLQMLQQHPASSQPMLRTTCSLLTVYLEKPPDQISIDLVNDTRNGFRHFLKSRKYAENSIRTYVNFARFLLNCAKECGWKSEYKIPKEWYGVFAIAKQRDCEDIVKDLARIKKNPKDVMIEDVDNRVKNRTDIGRSYYVARKQKSSFWRVLHDCKCTNVTPACILRGKRYAVPIEQFPEGLRKEVLELLRWKRADYSADRPKGGRHRETTSNNLSR